MATMYNDPSDVLGGGVVASSMGDQIRLDHYAKKALIEARREQYFSQLADVTSMPKNMGKTIKKYQYIPLLDDANANTQGIDAAGAAQVATTNGRLYGSSKDPGVILGKMPALREEAGRVNRVGFTRVEVTGTIKKYGFFDEYTQDSVDFDTDADLRMHINREMVNGAVEMSEDLLQIDLLAAAETTRWTGAATSVANTTPTALVDYGDLLALSIMLDQNRTPKQTKVISGTRMIDTKTIRGGRVLYVGTELIPTLEKMVDLHAAPAFVSVEKYADAGSVLNGEVGSIGNFRIVVVPEMMGYPAGGAAGVVTTFMGDGTNYDVYPMLCVGDGAFSTIGFQTDGKTVKFKIKHAAPGSTESYASDPYGETGFMSIKWFYGTLIQRPERLGIIWTGALAA